jgi:precorrin-2/cobalt-factor-2 C20-methyltransferase
MKTGKFCGIGVGPGDPELITMKGARVLARCRDVFVPKARMEGDSTALAIAGHYLSADSRVHELLFPMTSDQDELARCWEEAANRIAEVLERGDDACFLTLGDPLLYSTYIYLLRALRRRVPDIAVMTVPGITSFSAAAALTEFPVGEAREPITIVPTADDLEAVRKALRGEGTLILMKIGKRLGRVLDLLEEAGLMDQAVFVSHAGQDRQHIEYNLSRLKEDGFEAGYFSIMLVRTRHKGSV